jgi:ATP-grasp domain
LINATLIAKEGARDCGLLVEQCLEGPEYSVDAVWFGGTPVCELLLSRGSPAALAGPYYPDRLYLLDQSLSAGHRDAVLGLAREAVRALGVGSGATHTEVRFHGDTPYVLETTTRPGAGGMFYDLAEKAHGAEFTRALYLTQVCRDRAELDDRLGRMRWCAVADDTSYFWYNLPYRGCGIIREITGLDELRRRDDVLLCVCYKKPGSYIHSDSDLNTDYFCNIVGRHVREPGGPTLESLLDTYERMIEVLY